MNEDADFSEVLDSYLAQEVLYRTEGTEGVRNLCRLSRALGYKDFQNFGQFEGACYGDLIEFLQDNPGAVGAIVEWIGDSNNQDWKEKLSSELNEDSEEAPESKT